jgi:hypothetical protein
MASLYAVAQTALSLTVIASSLNGMATQKTKWHVQENREWKKVHRYDVDPYLRSHSLEELKSFFDSGCKLTYIRLSNGDYVIRRQIPGVGGGPIAGTITAVTGTVATGCATVGIWIYLAKNHGMVAANLGAAATAKGGIAITIEATKIATAAPVP